MRREFLILRLLGLLLFISTYTYADGSANRVVATINMV